MTFFLRIILPLEWNRERNVIRVTIGGIIFRRWNRERIIARGSTTASVLVLCREDGFIEDHIAGYNDLPLLRIPEFIPLGTFLIANKSYINSLLIEFTMMIVLLHMDICFAPKNVKIGDVRDSSI